MKYDIFISHSHVDKEFTEKITTDLIKSGLNVWVDFYELARGDVIQDAIQKGIRNSNFLLIVMSPDYFNSNWTLYLIPPKQFNINLKTT